MLGTIPGLRDQARDTVVKSVAKFLNKGQRVLYHDPMVKEMPKVISFRSGLEAAGTVR
jgi:hypothetical protein